MKILFTFITACILSIPAMAQLNCSNVVVTSFVNPAVADEVVLVNTTAKINGYRTMEKYTVNWGDGQPVTVSSWVTTFFHNYTSVGTYIIKMKLEAYDSVYNIYCADSTYDTVTVKAIDCSTLNAKISVSVHGDTVKLTNQCTPLKSYHINADYYVKWGDPSGSIITSNPGQLSYVYKASGTYQVRMIFSLSDPFRTCKDTTDTTISVTVIPPNEISGYAKLDSALTLLNDSVRIYLIRYDSSTQLLAPIDSYAARADDYVVFYFKNKPPGNYRTRAIMLSSQLNGSGNIPTYHNGEVIWKNAMPIFHTGGNYNNATVFMKQGKNVSGPGQISGNIIDIPASGPFKNLTGVEILLLDINNEPVAFTITDANGDYSFSNLPYGKYKIHPENINYTTTPMTLEVTAGQPVFSSVNFKRYSSTDRIIVPMGVNVGNVSGNDAGFTVAPNPAGSKITIRCKNINTTRAVIAITDIFGRVVYSTRVENATTDIDISHLAAGCYSITLTGGTDSETQKLVIQ